MRRLIRATALAATLVLCAAAPAVGAPDNDRTLHFELTCGDGNVYQASFNGGPAAFHLDTGGLFIGRRPGTGPVRYRKAEPSSERRRAADNVLAHGLLAVEMAQAVDAHQLPQHALGEQLEHALGAGQKPDRVAVVAGGEPLVDGAGVRVARRLQHDHRAVQHRVGLEGPDGEAVGQLVRELDPEQLYTG